MFVTGGVTNEYFAFTSTALLVPAGIEYFDMIGTLIGGSIVLRTSMLFALAFFIQFLIGGLSGIFVASPVLDYQAYGTYIVVAHFHYTLFAGSIFGFFAGVYHWFPKITGARLRERLGKLHLVLLVVGTNMTFLPMFFLGNDGMPRRISRYPPIRGGPRSTRSRRSAPGSSRSPCSSFLINVFVSLRRRVPAGDDPWLGHTLEWGTTSPPPPLNFERPLPPIRSYAPLLDLREDKMDRARRDAEVPRGLMRGGAIPILAWGTILLVLAVGNWMWNDKPVNSGAASAAVLTSTASARPSGWRGARRSAAARRIRATSPRPFPRPAWPLSGIGVSAGCALFGLALGAVPASTSGSCCSSCRSDGSCSRCGPSARAAGRRVGEERAPVSAPSLPSLLVVTLEFSRVGGGARGRSAVLYLWRSDARGGRGRSP